MGGEAFSSLNGCPKMPLSLLVSLTGLSGHPERVWGAALLVPSILRGSVIHTTGRRVEALQKEMSGARLCSVTILGIKMLSGV